MRYLVSAALRLLLALMCGASAAGAFEIETVTTFPARENGPLLRVISTADTDLFRPIILAFQRDNPDVTVEYTTVSSGQLMEAIAGEGAVFDVAISSAMDLQTKLANDGFTRTIVRRIRPGCRPGESGAIMSLPSPRSRRRS